MDKRGWEQIVKKPSLIGITRPALVTSLVVALCLAFAAPAAVGAADVNSLALRATYDVKASFGWTNRAVSVDSTARVTNTSNGQVSVIAFNLAPLRTGNAHLGIGHSERRLR